MATDRRTGAAKSTPKSREKQKQVLVVLLAIALLGVLWTQNMPNDEEVDVALDAMPTETQTPVIAEATPVAEPTLTLPTLTQEFNVLTLPSRSLDQILGEAPTLVIKAKPVNEMPPAESEPLIVRAVYGSGDKSAAIVGDTIVHAGEVLPDGRRVVGAGPGGLRMRSRLPVSSNPSP